MPKTQRDESLPCPHPPKRGAATLLRQAACNIGGLMAYLLPAPVVAPANFWLRESLGWETLVPGAVGVGTAILAGRLAQRLMPVPSLGVILGSYVAVCAAISVAGGLLVLLWRGRR